MIITTAVTNIMTIYIIHYYYKDYLHTNHLIDYSLVHNMINTTIVTNIMTIQIIHNYY